MTTKTILQTSLLTLAACAVMLAADPKTVDGVKAAEKA